MSRSWRLEESDLVVSGRSRAGDKVLEVVLEVERKVEYMEGNLREREVMKTMLMVCYLLSCLVTVSVSPGVVTVESGKGWVGPGESIRDSEGGRKGE